MNKTHFILCFLLVCITIQSCCADSIGFIPLYEEGDYWVTKVCYSTIDPAHQIMADVLSAYGTSVDISQVVTEHVEYYKFTVSKVTQGKEGSLIEISVNNLNDANLMVRLTLFRDNKANTLDVARYQFQDLDDPDHPPVITYYQGVEAYTKDDRTNFFYSYPAFPAEANSSDDSQLVEKTKSGQSLTYMITLEGSSSKVEMYWPHGAKWWTRVALESYGEKKATSELVEASWLK